jgi:phage gpG-like protein
MIKGTINGAGEVAGKLSGVAGRTRDALRKSVSRLALELLAKVKRDKLSGQVLNVRTGRLRRSITQRVIANGATIQGIVGTNVEYGKFHEYGQTIKGELKQKRAALKAGLKPSRPTLGSGDLPPRSFLRSALADMEPRIREEFAQAVHESSTTWRLL